jgi:enoyl-CoA hydratase
VWEVASSWLRHVIFASQTLMTDMMLCGRILSGEESERVGLVSYLVPEKKALAHAEALAAQIRENASAVNAAVITWLPRIRELSVEDGLLAEAFVCESVLRGSGDQLERLEQFLAKKSPVGGHGSTNGEGD